MDDDDFFAPGDADDIDLDEATAVSKGQHSRKLRRYSWPIIWRGTLSCASESTRTSTMVCKPTKQRGPNLRRQLIAWMGLKSLSRSGKRYCLIILNICFVVNDLF